MDRSGLSSTQACLGVAMLLIVAGMACPNAPWDARSTAEPQAREPVTDATAGPTTLARLRIEFLEDDGTPAAGLTVRVRDIRARTPCHEGTSDASGVCAAEIAIPADAESFVVEWLGHDRKTACVERAELEGLRLRLPPR